MNKQLPLALVLAWGLPVLAVGQQNLQLDDEQTPAPPQTQRPQTQSNDQEQPQRREAGFRGVNRTTRPQGQQEELVGYLAAKLQLANQAEIELATLAAQQAQNPEVKQFAEMLIREHRRLNDQLAEAAPGVRSSVTRERGERTSQAQQPRPSNDQPTRSAQNSAGELALAGVHQELIAISRRAVDHQVQMTSEMFRKKEGARFDICFLSQQIGAHIWLLSELQAIRDAGPAEFSQVVQQAEQSTRQHLEQAKQLAEKIEQDLTAGNSRPNARQSQSTQRDSIE